MKKDPSATHSNQDGALHEVFTVSSLQTVAYLFGCDGPRAFCLMLLKVAQGPLQVDVLSGRESGADLEKGGRASLFVACIPAFQDPVQIATLRAVHKYLSCGDEPSTDMHPVAKGRVGQPSG